MKERFLVRTIILAGSLLLQLSALCFYSQGAAGDVDLSFDPGSGVNGTVNAIAVQPDGKVIIGGQFTTVKGLMRANVARLNADGSGDSSFNAGTGIYSYSSVRPVFSIAVQPDGKVLVGHGYGIHRLNSDGSADTNFNSAVYFTPVLSVAVQPNGKTLIGGYFTIENGTNNGTGIARLNSDGSLDSTFNARAFQYLYYCEEACFYPVVNSIAVQSDGKVLAGGEFDNINGTNRNRIARFNADGSLDGSFNPAVETPNGPVNSVVVQPDGKVLMGGVFSMVNGMSRNGIARLHANGSLDSSFNPGTGTNSDVRSVVLYAAGKVLIGGLFSAVNGTNTTSGISRLHANGSLDSSFNPGMGANGSVQAIALQSGGKVFIGGWFSTVNGTNRNRVARLNADGSVDDGFHPGRGVDVWVSSLVVQPDGKVLVGGLFTFINGTNRYGSARLHANGSLDSTFISSSFNRAYGGATPTAVAVQSDGKVLVASYTSDYVWDGDTYNWIYSYFLTRFNVDGSLDSSFNPGTGVESLYPPGVTSFAVQSDGKVLIGGNFVVVNGTYRNGIARLHADGSLDGSFNPGGIGGAGGSVSSIALQADGKMLIGGSFTTVNGTNRSGIARLNSTGSLDTSFNPGTGVFYNAVHSVALQSDGKVLLGGGFASVNGTTRNGIARLNADGSLDSGFDPGLGADGTVRAIALQPDGNVLISGDFLTVNGAVRPYVARLHGDAFVRPSVTVLRSNSFVIASWPAGAAGYQLEQTTNLSQALSWIPVAQPSSTNAGQISVTLPATSGNKFFRLKSP